MDFQNIVLLPFCDAGTLRTAHLHSCASQRPTLHPQKVPGCCRNRPGWHPLTEKGALALWRVVAGIPISLPATHRSTPRCTLVLLLLTAAFTAVAAAAKEPYAASSRVRRVPPAGRDPSSWLLRRGRETPRTATLLLIAMVMMP